MSLTLDATLQTRMDSTIRKPLIDVSVQSAVASIPFYGNLLNGSETVNEKNPNIIIHSSGRLYAVYGYGATQTTLKYVYSDVARTYFTIVTFTSMGTNITGVSLCELTNGNIGIVYFDHTGTNTYALKQKIITVTGTAVSAATIVTISASFVSGPTVLHDAEVGGTGYIIIYSRISSTNYYAYKRTSADFGTWANESQLSIAGLTATWKLFDPDLKQVTNCDYVLSFAAVESVGPNGEVLSNIYQSISTDGGANWGSATKLTSYTQYNQVANHPVFAEKEANSSYLAYTEKQAALYMSTATPGWPGSDARVSSLHVDSVNRKLYCLNYMDCSVVRIDLDTWTIEGAWSTATTPAISTYFHKTGVAIYRMNKSAGKYVGIGAFDGGPGYYQLIDGEADIITTYALCDIPSDSIVQNVAGQSGNGSLQGTYIDLTNNRIWLLIPDGTTSSPNVCVGYISLADSGPTYTYVEVIRDTDIDVGELSGFQASGNFKVFPEDNVIIVNQYGTYEHVLLLYDLTTGARLKKYSYHDGYHDFPYQGILEPHYKDGIIYGGVASYTALYGQENIRGMVKIETTIDVITDNRPSYATLADYKLGAIHEMADGRFLVASEISGLVIFNPTTETWDVYNSTTVPGLDTDFDSIYAVDYDETSELIFMGGNAGYAAISVYGDFQQTQYMVATYVSSWTYGAANPLVAGNNDYDASIVCDPVDFGIWSFWTNRDVDEYSIKWAHDSGSVSLNDFLVRGKPISISRSIDGSPNSLSLTLSHGHLFDPFNSASALRALLDKGNQIVVKFGENISGTPYWEDQGTFHIISRKLQYKKGDYPALSLEAQDIRYIWKDLTIVATEYYDNQQPDYVIEDLLDDHTSLTAGQLAVPTMDIAVPVDVQWTDTALLDCIQQVCDRFGYYHTITVDNDFTCRKISLNNAIDHTYTTSNQILSIAPDDSFSDFTNRVTVEGAERDYSEVLYTEELVSQLSGTVGWWGYKKSFTIYYSNDQTKRVRYPRLKVVESVLSIGYKLGGALSTGMLLLGIPAAGITTAWYDAGDFSQTITYLDPDEHYCIVSVEAPNLVPILIDLIIQKIAVSWVPDLVIAYGAGITIPIGSAIRNILTIEIMLVLGAVGNYQLEIWGQPVGEEKRSVEATADDEELQGKIGYVVESRIEDSLCYTVAECNQVAQHELDIVTAQQERVSIQKISHLQDEEGDTLRLIHPYSGQNMDIFITDITREYTPPEGLQEEASCIDSLEGWVIR